MRIAIVGSGVSGLVAAYLLHPRHEVTVFEARERIGGHVNTVDVEGPDGETVSVDTGFIVFNPDNYPLFTRLLDRLGVGSQPSDMSFGVRSDRSGIEYSSATTRSLFTQKRNLFRPEFHGMLRDILRFNREAEEALGNGSTDRSLRSFIAMGGFSSTMVEHYLVPMGSALWSAPADRILEMPARFFIRFFHNHRMLAVSGQPLWRVVKGGSARYVERLTQPFADRIRTGHPVRRVERRHAQVLVDGERFDRVIFACHPDQALKVLAQPTRNEREILGAIPYQDNDVVLHTDTSVLPRRRGAWASWNYWVRQDVDAPATVTYDMNRLQSLRGDRTYCVTLNATDDIDPDAVLYRTRYRHPVFTRGGIQAQERHRELDGANLTHYCGAYWGFGFHEDGVRSAVQVARSFGVDLS